jgi:hypothetical protein
MQKIRTTGTLALSTALVIAALLPALISSTFASHGQVTDHSSPTAALTARGIDTSNITISTTPDLTVGLGTVVTGYVNFLDDADVINTRPQSSSRAIYENKLVHEFGHIAQKRLVEKVSPAGALNKAASVVALDAALRGATPDVAADRPGAAPTVVPGLEANADCIAVIIGGPRFTTWYVDSSAACSARDLGAARSIIEGEWPSEANIARWSAAQEAEKAEDAVRATSFRPPASCITIVNEEGRTRNC